MLNNEIHRLIRCIVEASAESNVTFEEIQAELAQQFGKELVPQVYRDIESHDPQDITPKAFLEKTKKFIKDEIGGINSCFIREEYVIKLFCIFHELKQETPDGELVDREKLRERFMQACPIARGTTNTYFVDTNRYMKYYLEKSKGICLKNNASITIVLDKIYPYVLEM